MNKTRIEFVPIYVLKIVTISMRIFLNLNPYSNTGFLLANNLPYVLSTSLIDMG